MTCDNLFGSILTPLFPDRQTIQMADVDGLVTVTSARRPISLHSLTTTSLQQKLSLSWTDVALYDSPSSSLAYINVTMEVTLPNDSAFSSWSLGVQTQPNSASSSSVGMWEAIISVPLSAGGGSDGELFFPSGYGETYYDPTESTGGSVSGLYPSGMCNRTTRCDGFCLVFRRHCGKGTSSYFRPMPSPCH